MEAMTGIIFFLLCGAALLYIVNRDEEKPTIVKPGEVCDFQKAMKRTK